MRNLILTLALAIGLTAYAGAKIEWKEVRHDFGAFDETLGPVTAEFVFYNRGDEILVVLGARANCGCTTPKYSQEIVMPGDSAILTVSYDPEGRPGRFEKKIYVDTNTDPKRSTLSIRGVSVGTSGSVKSRYPVEVGPSMRLAHPAALLGNIKRGHIKSVFESGYNTSVDTLRPVVEDLPTWLEVSVVPEKVGPGEQVSFDFFVVPDKTDRWDMICDTITIRPFAGSADALRMPVVVTIDENFDKLTEKDLAKAPDAVVSPAKLQPVTVTDTPQTAFFEISNHGKSPLKIRRVYTVTEGIRFDVRPDETVKPGKTRRIKVEIAPDATRKDKVYSVVATIVTNDPLKPKTSVSIPVVYE